VGPLILLGALLAVMWAVMIRPQRRRQAEQKRVLETISPGDEVLTVGGIFGIVHDTDEDDNLIVEIAEGIRVRVARRAVAAVVKDEDDDDADADEDDADEDDDVIDGEATEDEAGDAAEESQTQA
jgi:preprotein translocase subunit YajC